MRLTLNHPATRNSLSEIMIDELREAINRTDDELLDVLIDRMKISEKIGEYKKENKVTILQTGRWEQVLNDRTATALMVGLDEEFVRKLYVLIHDESIRKQTEIMSFDTHMLHTSRTV